MVLVFSKNRQIFGDQLLILDEKSLRRSVQLKIVWQLLGSLASKEELTSAF
jgi:hypothetical protein